MLYQNRESDDEKNTIKKDLGTNLNFLKVKDFLLSIYYLLFVFSMLNFNSLLIKNLKLNMAVRNKILKF